jgi:hypothetical protein
MLRIDHHLIGGLSLLGLLFLNSPAGPRQSPADPQGQLSRSSARRCIVTTME